MTKTFLHKFFTGEDAVECYRHINPDGSEGGIVSCSAKVGAQVLSGDYRVCGLQWQQVLTDALSVLRQALQQKGENK